MLHHHLMLHTELTLQQHLMIHHHLMSQSLDVTQSVNVTSSLNFVCFFFAPCFVIWSYNINQRNAPLLKIYFNFYNIIYMFRQEGSSSGKRLYVLVWNNLYTCQRHKQSYRWHVNELYHTCT